MIKIFIADDHDLLRKSLCVFLEQTKDIQVVAKTANGEEAVTQASLYLPDVAIIDISMPVMDGIEVTRQIHQYCPSTRVLILSFSDSSENVWRALEAGALGYVLKDALVIDLLPAIRAVAEGNHFFSHRISGIAHRYLQNNPTADSMPTAGTLSSSAIELPLQNDDQVNEHSL
jgi:DNA-binding NarL/FixJ family response regulator